MSAAREALARVTQALKDGDTLGASLALVDVERLTDALYAMVGATISVEHLAQPAEPAQEAAAEWSSDRALGFEEGKVEGRRLAQWREPTPREAGSVPADFREQLLQTLNQARCLERRTVWNGELADRILGLLKPPTNTQSTASEASGEVAK